MARSVGVYRILPGFAPGGTNTAYKQWPRVFNNDATLTTAILDRLVHHCETVTIEGKSYRMKDKT